MTTEEAKKVRDWCDQQGYLRPAEDGKGNDITLSWYPVAGQPVFSTKVFDSARYWCKIMQLESLAGNLGYQVRKLDL